MKNAISENSPTHPAYVEIRAFALKSSREQDGDSSLANHIQKCDGCKEMYANICEYDPELNSGQRIIAAELWESLWQNFQSRLPSHLDKLLQTQAQHIMQEMEKSVRHEFFAHLSAVEKDLEVYLRKDKEQQADIQALRSNLYKKQQNLINALCGQINDLLNSLYAGLIHTLQLKSS